MSDVMHKGPWKGCPECTGVCTPDDGPRPCYNRKKKASGAQPGNKNASKADAKTAVITIRVTEEQKQEIKDWAGDTPVSEWILGCIKFNNLWDQPS